MTEPTSGNWTRTSAVIPAPRETLYRAFTEPEALAAWQAPGEMNARVHAFDGRVGGGYRMSLFYPDSMTDAHGKSAGREDRYTARFVELTPPARIVEAIAFETDDPAFAGEMLMTVTLTESDGGTEVTILFERIPPGIRPEDNETGTRLSLEKLARYVRQDR